MIHLYVKTHNVTGLKYFGKTTRKDPYRYRGSGKYWIRHLRVHGNNVTTEIIGTYTDQQECMAAAIAFSKKHKIVESVDWANLRNENGLDGAPVGNIGHKFTDEERGKISAASKKNWSDPTYRQLVLDSRSGMWTDELKNKQSKRLKEEFWTDERKRSHSQKMTGRKNGPSPRRGCVLSEEHKEGIRQSLRGKPKSPEHLEKMRVPKPRVCRLVDRKEMSTNHFTRWIKSLL